jgi:hypothetical protein
MIRPVVIGVHEAKARLLMRRSPLLPIHLPIQLAGLEQRQRVRQQFARRWETPRARGHAAKIAAAVTALRAAGKLPEWLNLAEVSHRCDGWFRAQGLLAHEIPSRSSYRRHLPKALRAACDPGTCDAF